MIGGEVEPPTIADSRALDPETVSFGRDAPPRTDTTTPLGTSAR